MNKKLYQAIAQTFQAYLNCLKEGNSWQDKHAERIENLVSEYMPSGSGFDCGTNFDWGQSRKDRLVFNTAFHHMDEMGGYIGWSDHSVIVTPSLTFDIDIRVTGKDYDGIKEYIGDIFHDALMEDVEEKIKSMNHAAK